jgi:hypothetical protein
MVEYEYEASDSEDDDSPIKPKRIFAKLPNRGKKHIKTVLKVYFPFLGAKTLC